MEEANNVKKQLPFYTVTAGYREKRQAYSVIRYTHITLLDIDDQPEEKLEELRGKINGDQLINSRRKSVTLRTNK